MGPALAALLLVTLVASAVTPCRDEAAAAAQRMAAASVHDHRTHDSGEAVASTIASDGWCRGARPMAELRAVCVCGCSDRPTVAGVPTGFGWALPPAAPALVALQPLSFAPRSERALPDSSADPIEHVPLAA